MWQREGEKLAFGKLQEVVQLQVAERDVRHLLELAEGLGRAVGLQPRVALRRV